MMCMLRSKNACPFVRGTQKNRLLRDSTNPSSRKGSPFLSDLCFVGQILSNSKRYYFYPSERRTIIKGKNEKNDGFFSVLFLFVEKQLINIVKSCRKNLTLFLVRQVSIVFF